MASITNLLKSIFWHDTKNYFQLPKTDAELPNPPHDHALGSFGARAMDWLNRVSGGGGHVGPVFYVIVGVFLTIVTVLELWVFTLELGSVFVPTMLFLMILKFVPVVAFYMHLRFDSKLLTWVFASGLLLAVAVYIVVLVIQGQLAPPDPQIVSASGE